VADGGSAAGLKRATSARTSHYEESIKRRRQVLNITTSIAAVVSVIFATLQLVTDRAQWQLAAIQFAAAAVFVAIPLLHRFHELVAPLTLLVNAFASLAIAIWDTGTGFGLQFFFLVGVTVAVLMLGIEHIVLASSLVAIGAVVIIALQFTAPADRGVASRWSLEVGFVVSILAACVMTVATVAYLLSEIARAEGAMEVEYERSESLLANMIPYSIAVRLKQPTTTIIADEYDDASVLFADIAGYTEWVSQTTAADVVEFLNRLYTKLDDLVAQHGLEKIKTSGDCYIVVGGLPQPRADHLRALARLALDMTDAVAGIINSGGHTASLRIGIGAGPVAAGVIGTRRFFYDVWGDAVNVASRMESSGITNRTQVTDDVYERLKGDFDFEHRGEIMVKGKGLMRTWFLVGQKNLDPSPIAAA
jgi:adenylate cyclase